MGIFHNRVSSLQQSIKPNGIGSPEFQKRLVEAAENVVANEENGPIGASSNGGLASPAGETSAQVRMEDLQHGTNAVPIERMPKFSRGERCTWESRHFPPLPGQVE